MYIDRERTKGRKKPTVGLGDGKASVLGIGGRSPDRR